MDDLKEQVYEVDTDIEQGDLVILQNNLVFQWDLLKHTELVPEMYYAWCELHYGLGLF